jgi:hypothetical protein
MTLAGDFTLPPGSTATAMGRPPFVDQALPFDQLPPQLQGLNTRVVYLDPNYNLFNLAGPNAGAEGCRLCTQLYGDQQWPYEQVLTNSPYIMGADINRQNIPERKFNFGIIIGSHSPPMNEYQYRMSEARWWAGQDEANDGWLGIYTRFSGWRWIPVRPDETVKTPQKMDSTAYGNNASRWDITWVATRPYFTKPALYLAWSAKTARSPKPYATSLLGKLVDELIGDVYYQGTIPIVNRGDLPSYVQYLVSSPGQAIVQDNDSDRLVPLPQTVASVGTYLCDTEPSMRTMTAANDPTDNLATDLIRQSVILSALLSGVLTESEPLQLAFTNKFIYTIPPQTSISLTVMHSESSGSITAIVPQRFKRSR